MARDPIWLRPETAGVGRPAEHSRAEITAAAVELAEKEGYAKVSMRSVAAALGTGAASLYRYVASRTELTELMVDHMLRRMELPVTGEGPAADVIATGLAGFRLVVDHPWMVDAYADVPFNGGPGTARLAEHYLSVLADHPAPPHRKMEVIGIVGGMVQQWGSFVVRQDVPQLMANQARFFAHIAASGEYPHIAALSATPPPADSTGIESPEATLERLLLIIVRGTLDVFAQNGDQDLS